MDLSSSAVECQTFNRESVRSNPICCCIEASTFSLSPRRPSSFSCIDEYLIKDSCANMRVTRLRAVIAMWLNASQRSQIGVRMNRSAKGVKCKAL